MPLTRFCSEENLRQITVSPSHGNFVVSIVFDNGKDFPVTRPPHRMIGIDLGVDNTAAITNNSGLPCLLFKGGVYKAAAFLKAESLGEMFGRRTTTESR